MTDLFLGIDGGQSHTQALVADENGRILGRGRSGPSNHAEQPGGRERLRRAVQESVAGALMAAQLPQQVRFACAYCAMSGGAEYKTEIISSQLETERLIVAHDAPAALTGGTSGRPGIVVIAGTGSVAYGENENGETARTGGWGHIFGDEGSAYWIALQAIKSALWDSDKDYPLLIEQPLGLTPTLSTLALNYFAENDLASLLKGVYSERISRDEFAGFASIVHRAALEGDESAQKILSKACCHLFTLANLVARKLRFRDPLLVQSGGVWKATLVSSGFANLCQRLWPAARLITPAFDPAVGALLLAYRAAGVELKKSVLENLKSGE